MPRGINAGMFGEKTKDGFETNTLWAEAQALNENESVAKGNLSSLISTKVYVPGEAIAAQANAAPYEEASEYGLPVAHRATLDYLQVGYTFSWRDSAWRMTWQYSQDATADEIRAQISAQIIGDRNGVHRSILGPCYNPAPRLNREGLTVFGFYNADGTVPPSYDGQDFRPDTSHYMSTGSAEYDGDDLTRMIDSVVGKGYGPIAGYQVIILVNQADSATARTLRASVGGRYDFIPGAGGPARFEPVPVVGQRAPADFNGLAVIGSYGPALIIETQYAPRGYLLCLAVSGPGSLRNPVGLREHARQNLRGLQIIPGATPAYPLVDSHYAHGFGSGVRYRGAGCAMQITTAAGYTAPAEYATGTF